MKTIGILMSVGLVAFCVKGVAAFVAILMADFIITTVGLGLLAAAILGMTLVEKIVYVTFLKK